MLTEYGFRPFEIGDIDVVKHEGVYHLFHLILPNHDFIAHAVSTDGLRWRRVKNALFIGDPREWDDDMLWTMQVTPNPDREGCWRMYYTGLSMGDHGRIQRIGLAHSDDLYHWQKDTSGSYPLEISGDDYESSVEEGRNWVSFRDPFWFIDDDGRRYLLAAARVKYGPLIRRGCVALGEEQEDGSIAFGPPLFHPMRYDDIEVPSIAKLGDTYYLIGSIREDIKVHYWCSDRLSGPYENFSDNVLLPQGNYAARISGDKGSILIWSFFFQGLKTEGRHFMVPPKELKRRETGELFLQSFQGFDRMVTDTISRDDLLPWRQLFGNPFGNIEIKGEESVLSCKSGFEVFLLSGAFGTFRLTGKLHQTYPGKCGFVFRIDDQGDGYHLSLDLRKGLVQIRAWSHNANGIIEEAFHYHQLQAYRFIPIETPASFSLVAFEQYLEFSLNNMVLLSLADEKFTFGNVGVYLESATIHMQDLKLDLYELPTDRIYPESETDFFGPGP